MKYLENGTKKHSAKPFLVLSAAAALGLVGMFCYSQWSMKKDSAKNNVTNGFYRGSFMNVEGYTNIHIKGHDTDGKSCDINVDTITGIWDASASYNDKDAPEMTVTDFYSGSFDSSEVEMLAGYLDRFSDEAPFVVNGEDVTATLLETAIESETLSSEFATFLGFFTQDKLSLGEFIRLV